VQSIILEPIIHTVGILMVATRKYQPSPTDIYYPSIGQIVAIFDTVNVSTSFTANKVVLVYCIQLSTIEIIMYIESTPPPKKYSAKTIRFLNLPGR
jgi:hypothetical protein